MTASGLEILRWSTWLPWSGADQQQSVGGLQNVCQGVEQGDGDLQEDKHD